VLGLDVPGFLAYSDSAMVLQKGQVVMQGSAADVAANPLLASYLGV
jgi:branched-chain amino acid transport system ATP-binding protein